MVVVEQEHRTELLRDKTSKEGPGVYIAPVRKPDYKLIVIDTSWRPREQSSYFLALLP